MKCMLAILFFLLSVFSQGQSSEVAYIQHYENAYVEITDMLKSEKPYNFKRAVFLTENAYLDNRLDYQKYCDKIDLLKRLSQAYSQANQSSFKYDHSDKKKVLKYASVYKIMTDTSQIIFAGQKMGDHLPFIYDFQDPFGKKDWTKMFVTKLLDSHSGNCHSLPYLYKIIVEEMGEKAYLALAPNHIYIKHYSEKTGMYNTELTSASFPIDAWLMASGYIHLDAVRNGIYMDTLNNQKSLALCLIDLAKGYQKKSGKGGSDFVLKCCNTALEYFPNYINALLLKSEVLKNQLDKMMASHQVNNPDDILHLPEAKKLFDKYEKLTVKIYQLGYRRMPEQMYLDWLALLKEEKEKYSNKKIINNFKSDKPD